jgi:DNA-binding helix-hairpin-helix protein with protein kinase domain
MIRLTLLRAHARIHVEHELGRGGEGSVFTIREHPNHVAKIYTAPPSQDKIQKLHAMAGAANADLLKIAAWPIDLLADESGAVHGFMMPRVAARRDIHELYSPKSRFEAFPDADFKFLTHVATNIARAFAAVHQLGHNVGDVNHGNVLVGPDGTVMLIDCDSFQITTGSRTFTCEVGVPLFTAPELHGRAFRGLLRTNSHDGFGLAVLLFHLLYMGRHPFAGRYDGTGDMPIERALVEGRFAYGPLRAGYKMERPPGTIALETMGSTVAALFVRAFAFAGPGSHGERPDAKTWVDALRSLASSLRICSVAAWHHYPSGLGACPWCGVEAQTAIRLFGQRGIAANELTGVVDVATLWKAIAAVPQPDADPALPSERPWTLPAGVQTTNRSAQQLQSIMSLLIGGSGVVACNAMAADGGALLAFAAYVLAFALWPRVPAAKRLAADRACAAATKEWQAALARWQREASRNAFAEALKQLAQQRAELEGLQDERRRRLVRLEAGLEQRQRQRYLDRFRIDRASIRGIGPGRTSMLGSYGIETAADVEDNKVRQIPGFGEALTSELLRWRRAHEQNFRFNPNEGVDQRDIHALDKELGERRRRLQTTLRQGPAALTRLQGEIGAARARLMPSLDEKWIALKVAEAARSAL